MARGKMGGKGFTLLEFVMVITMLGIIAAIAIPRIIDMRRQANQVACDANVGAIRDALSVYFARQVIKGGTGFPATLHQVDFLPYLTAGTLPICSLGSDYNARYNSSTGVLTTHTHP